MNTKEMILNAYMDNEEVTMYGIEFNCLLTEEDQDNNIGIVFQF